MDRDWIWLVIIIGVGLFKAIGKLMERTATDETPAAPVARAKPRPQPRPPPRQPSRAQAQRPATVRPMPPPARPVQPARPAQPERLAQPVRPAAIAPPAGPAGGQPRGWRATLDDVQDFLTRLEQAGKPTPVPAAPPPPVVQRAVPRPTAPAPVAAATPAPAHPVSAAAPAVVSRSRASLWAVALRDRGNVRNLIIGQEILGPPIALRD